MEEEPPESTGEEEYEGEPPGKRKLIKILAVLIALAVAGGAGAWYAISVLGNSPPSAAFSLSPQDLRLFVDASDSTDPNGNIATYTWDWGDENTSEEKFPTTFHDYDAAGTYDVTLTVTDARGAASTKRETVTVQALPTAMFTARTNRMEVSFDATGSFVLGGGQITAYAWDFGDGQTGTAPVATHKYQTPGRYTVTLTVTDDRARTMSTSRLVSPADTTVDIVYDQLFQTAACPYKSYWAARYQSYGDQILRDSAPCTSYYPWVLFSSDVALQPINPSFVYTVYHLDARVRNHPAFTVQDPVLLPIFDASVQPDAGSYIQLNLTFDYIDDDIYDALRPTPFAVNSKYVSDGFGYLVRGSLTMDLTMSRRIFGVDATTPADARTWWASHTGFARATCPTGMTCASVEARFANWLTNIGNGTYDIYNGFEWYYETDITDFNATVEDDGTTRVNVFWDGWGYDVLLARWFYWGGANYSKAVTQPYPPNQPDTMPRGWSPLETCWCELGTIDGRITTALDLDYRAIGGYVVMAWSHPGTDGIFDTADDLPSWVWEPTLMDYVPPSSSDSAGASSYPHSELAWYEDVRRVHATPGSYAYGQSYDYILTPARMRLDEGYSFTFVLPRDARNRPLAVPWYDPDQSEWNPTTKIGDYVSFLAPMTLRSVKVENQIVAPGDLYLWDARGKVLSFAGPYVYGTSGLPLYGSPWIEFGPETGA